jgi:hypothetical protein
MNLDDLLELRGQVHRRRDAGRLSGSAGIGINSQSELFVSFESVVLAAGIMGRSLLYVRTVIPVPGPSWHKRKLGASDAKRQHL